MEGHFESRATLAASPQEVFAYLDDPSHLAAHMAKPSWAMAGGRMELRLDEAGGRRPGSRMRETVGAPKLLVIGPYRMGFDIAAYGSGSMLRVLIEYALPDTASGRWLGRLFGPAYARWCTERMVSDAVRHFTGGLP